MKQNENKTAAICSAFLDLLINVAVVYLAILILGYENNLYNKTTVAIATICSGGSVLIYFVCDM